MAKSRDFIKLNFKIQTSYKFNTKFFKTIFKENVEEKVVYLKAIKIKNILFFVKGRFLLLTNSQVPHGLGWQYESLFCLFCCSWIYRQLFRRRISLLLWWARGLNALLQIILIAQLVVLLDILLSTVATRLILVFSFLLQSLLFAAPLTRELLLTPGLVPYGMSILCWSQLPQNLEKPRKLSSHSLPIPPSCSTQELLEALWAALWKLCGQPGQFLLKPVTKPHDFSPGFPNRAAALKPPYPGCLWDAITC